MEAARFLGRCPFVLKLRDLQRLREFLFLHAEVLLAWLLLLVSAFGFVVLQ